MPPGHLDRLVPVLLLAALLRAGSIIWTVSMFRFPNIDVGIRARLYARNVGMMPGLLVLLAAVFAAFWAARVVAFTPVLVRRSRLLFLAVLSVATFVTLVQLVGLVWDLTPDTIPFETFPGKGAAILDEAAGVALGVAAVASSSRRLRAMPD